MIAAAAATLYLARRRHSGKTALDHVPALDDPIDESVVESFPASDPPAHAATLGAKTPA